jgi:hypothetical protein
VVAALESLFEAEDSDFDSEEEPLESELFDSFELSAEPPLPPPPFFLP